MSRKATKQELREKRAEIAQLAKYKHTTDVRAKKGKGNLASKFITYMDPMERDMAELQYELCLLEPEKYDPVGIPLAVGGVAPTSMKIRCRQRSNFLCDATGNAAVAAFNCAGPQAADFIASPAIGNEDINREMNRQNHLPWLNIGAGVVRQPLMVGQLAGPATPAFGAPVPTLPNLAQITAFDPQISLLGTQGRIVAQEFRVYPAGNNLLSQGIGAIFEATTNGSAALNAVNMDQAYALQSVDANVVTLSNWRPGEKFASNRFPLQVEDTNWLPCQAPSDIYRVPFNTAGTVWAAFFAQGCAANQPFTVELITVYEYRNNAYPFGTPNLTTNAGFELTAGMRAEHGTPAGTAAELAMHRAGVMASSRARQMGQKHAAGFFKWLKDSALPFVGRAAESILPKIGGLGLSMLTDGVIPPGIGTAALEAGVQAFHPLSKVEPVVREPAIVVPVESPSDHDDNDNDNNDVLVRPAVALSQAPIPTAPKPSPKEGFEARVRVDLRDIEECHECNCLH